MWELEKLAYQNEKFKKENPELAEEIQDLFELCLCEIEDGASQTNEIYLYEESVNQLINKN
jgi:hypothetical protein